MTEWQQAAGAPGRSVVRDVRLARVPGAAVNIPRARAILEDALSPCPESVLLAELAALSMLTRRREGTPQDEAVRARVWLAALSPHPADAVVHALRRAGETMVFFPALAEIMPLIREAMAARVLALHRLAAMEMPAPPSAAARSTRDAAA